MAAVIERMREALNRHDLEAFLGCFDPNYRSEQPAHPNRGFGGKEQVRKNWAAMFESFPDFEAQLLRHTAQEGVVWSEWHWTATGTGLNMAGVTIMGVEDDRIVWTRLYIEPVEENGQDIDEAIRTITGEGQRAGVEETAWRLLQVMNDQQAASRTDADVFPAAVAQEVGINPDTNAFFAVVGYLEGEDYIDPSPNATLVGATVFRITDKGMAWLNTPPRRSDPIL